MQRAVEEARRLHRLLPRRIVPGGPGPGPRLVVGRQAELAHDRLRAVAVVQVNVDDGDVPDVVRRGRVDGAADDVVEPAEAARDAAGGVVAGRADRHKGRGHVGAADEVDGVVDGADGGLDGALRLGAQVEVVRGERGGDLEPGGLDGLDAIARPRREVGQERLLVDGRDDGVGGQAGEPRRLAERQVVARDLFQVRDALPMQVKAGFRSGLGRERIWAGAD